MKSFRNFAIIHVNNFSYRFFIFDMTEEDVIEFIKDFEPDDEFETTKFLEELTLIKEVHQKSVCFVIIGTLKTLNLNFSKIFVINIILDVSFQN